MTKIELQKLAIRNASRFELEPNLVLGLVDVESSWNPKAYWYETGYFSAYVESAEMFTQYDATEQRKIATSWGLMQMMGGTYLSMMGVFGKITYNDLRILMEDPEMQLAQGCKYLRWCFDAEADNTIKALLRYNGGGDKNYPLKVMAQAYQHFVDLTVVRAYSKMVIDPEKVSLDDLQSCPPVDFIKVRKRIIGESL